MNISYPLYYLCTLGYLWFLVIMSKGYVSILVCVFMNKELISDGYISKSVIVSATSCLTFKIMKKSLSKLFQHFIFPQAM